jgi:hypothetical protein
MKKSKFIKQVLKSKDNTVFVNEDQVANAIEVFEKLGMLPPERMEEIADNDSGCIEEGSRDVYINEWERE